MKKVLLAITLLSATTYSYAENRLFPTDILAKGEAELSAGISDSRSDRDVTYNGNFFHEQFDQTNESVRLRYGLGNHWHVGVALPYRSDYQYNNHNQSSHEGWQNPSAWAKYSFTEGTQSPYAMTAELNISPNLTGKNTNAYSGTLSISRDLGQGLKPYASYEIERVTNHDYHNNHTVTLGAFKELNSHLTFTPTLFYSYDEASHIDSSSHAYGLTLAGLAKISEKTTFRAGFSFYKASTFNSKDQVFQAEKLTGHSVSANIYHLF